MLSFFKRRTSEQHRQAADSDKAAHPRLHEPALTGRVYVIGDVHGCATKLAALEQAIKVDCGLDYDNATLVYVGDVVDRGPDSATVLDRLSFPTRAGPRRITLFGNHEQMMLKFLKDPSGKSSWLDFGGVETLSSYGIHADPQRGWNLPARSWRYTLDANIPAAHTEFLSTLPCCAQFGRYFISHSGIDVKKPLADHLLFGDLTSGGIVKVTVADNKLVLDVSPHEPRGKQKAKRSEPV